MAELHCTVVTPETTALTERADFVALPLFDGEIGIAPGRAALIGRLGYGEMRLHDGKKILRYYLDGGFVQVLDDQISVLTNRAIPAERIDASAARQQLHDALRREATSPELLEIRDRLLAQARSQLRVYHRTQEQP